MVKNLPANARDIRKVILIPGGEDPLLQKWQPTPAPLPGESLGWWKLAGYSPLGGERVGHSIATKQQQ